MRISVYKNQTGVAHLMLILVVVVLAGVGGAGYYVWNKQKKSDSSSGTSTASQKQLEVECKKEIDDKDFCKFASTVDLNGDYKVTINSTAAEGKSVMILESNKGNTRMAISSDGTEEYATISIANTLYTKMSKEGWTKMTTKATTTEETVEENTGIDVDEITADNTKYEKVGKEACGTLTCFKYKITDSDKNTSEQFVWFDDKEYKLRRYTAKDSEGTYDMTVSYESSAITAPSPIIETPSAENMTQAEIEAAIKAAMQ
ncbi:MAG: hypothetical protein M3Q14_03425 [bacterium]|nr:hypothetical protein [bacterium]